ncbi:hypothetical protein KCU86_g64, partial [Aureobasidium melanogenum]
LRSTRNAVLSGWPARFELIWSTNMALRLLVDGIASFVGLTLSSSSEQHLTRNELLLAIDIADQLRLLRLNQLLSILGIELYDAHDARECQHQWYREPRFGTLASAYTGLGGGRVRWPEPSVPRTRVACTLAKGWYHLKLRTMKDVRRVEESCAWVSRYSWSAWCSRESTEYTWPDGSRPRVTKRKSEGFCARLSVRHAHKEPCFEFQHSVLVCKSSRAVSSDKDWHLFHGRRSSVRIIEIHKGVLTEPEDALVQAALFTCPLLLVHQAV